MTLPSAYASSNGYPTVPTARRAGVKHPSLFPKTRPSIYFGSPAPGSYRATYSLTMGTKCAQPGEIQTVVIKATPGYNVAWAVLWPDGQPHSEWKAQGIAKIPASGIYTAGFPIPAVAKLGRARTDMSLGGVTNKKSYTAQDFTFWEIARPC